jgi:hypothetical protein
MCDGSLRDAAEKAWLAVVDATDRHLARQGVTVEVGVRGHAQRKQALIRSEQFALLNRYAALRDELHGDCFYGGDCEPESYVRRKLAEAGDYVTELTGCEVSRP